MSTAVEEMRMALPRTQAAEVDLTPLVEAHAATLYRVAYSILRNSAAAEDVVQDSFVRALEHRRKLPELRDVRVWLVRIAWNLALDHLAQARRRKQRPGDSGNSDALLLSQLVSRGQPADAALDEARRLRAVLAAMDRLPRLERQALLLAGVEELSTAEIAAVLERSESAVRALLFRARTRLKERLKKGGYA